jgi:hypothetical protein
MDIKQKMEAINDNLRSADEPTRAIGNAAKSIGALIFAIEYLREIVEQQQASIERLEDVLQNHLETTPRRRAYVND